MTDQLLHSHEFRAIASFYGERRAERSQVPLIRHIHEGVAIIEALRDQLPDDRNHYDFPRAARAYCLHPLFQNDAELHHAGRVYAGSAVPGDSAFLVMLAMEYRWRANNWLADKVSFIHYNDGAPPLLLPRGFPDAGPMPEVRAMLIADKVQNRKDFLRHHKGTHARSAELDLYFQVWLEHLGVSDSLYEQLCQAAEAVTHE